MEHSQKLTKTKRSDRLSCFCMAMRLSCYGYTIEERKKVIDYDSALADIQEPCMEWSERVLSCFINVSAC